MTETSEAAPGIVAIDTLMAGRGRLLSAYLVRAAEPALVETGPTTSLEPVLEALRELGLGPDDLAHVVVTHVHLDHSGGAGGLVSHFPGATVWAHHRGAPHLADPTRLVQSAARAYGEERLRQLFGPVEAVPADRLRSIDEGDRIDLGDRRLEVMHTPGHASHHVSLVDSETGALFTGDALGIHLPDVRVLRPATPPPEIDVEQMIESIGRMRDRNAPVLMFSHYGPVQEVEELCDIATRRIRKWAEIVRDALEESEDLDRVAEVLDRRTASEFVASEEAGRDVGGDRARYEALADMRMNAAGLARYWRRRRDAEAATDPGRAGAK